MKLSKFSFTGQYIQIGWRKCWVMFDLDNGHRERGSYMWVFKTKKEANDHRVKQHNLKFGARLSKPKLIKFNYLNQD